MEWQSHRPLLRRRFADWRHGDPERSSRAACDGPNRITRTAFPVRRTYNPRAAPGIFIPDPINGNQAPKGGPGGYGSAVGEPYQLVNPSSTSTGNYTAAPIAGNPCGWYWNNCGPNDELFSFHPGGINVLMCDGAVHYLSERSIRSPSATSSLATRPFRPRGARSCNKASQRELASPLLKSVSEAASYARLLATSRADALSGASGSRSNRLFPTRDSDRGMVGHVLFFPLSTQRPRPWLRRRELFHVRTIPPMTCPIGNRFGHFLASRPRCC